LYRPRRRGHAHDDGQAIRCLIRPCNGLLRGKCASRYSI
jgi:hypothetical protein